jgi:5-methylcytosine-specific restriction endonuclease McrA
MNSQQAATYLGNPCKRGHAGERYVSTGACVECVAVRRSLWQRTNREKSARATMAWNRRNRARLNGRARERYACNAEAERARSRAWARQNPLKNRLKTARARARATGAEGDGITVAEWEELCEKFGHACAYCGAARPLTIDHVVPLSRGGRHERANILPACKSCNCSKNRASLESWIPPLIALRGER